MAFSEPSHDFCQPLKFPRPTFVQVLTKYASGPVLQSIRTDLFATSDLEDLSHG